MSLNIFRQLDSTELDKFQQWARDNYKVGTQVDDLWHPSIQAECDLMNKEAMAKARADQERIKEVVDTTKSVEDDYKGLIIVQANFSGSISKSKKMSRGEIDSLLAGVPEKDREKKKRELAAINKRLFAKDGFPELDAIESAKNGWREEIRRCGIPFGPAQTAMKTSLIPRVDDIAEKIERELPALVADLIRAYPNAIKKETVDSELYNERDYRAIETLEKLFSFRIGWFGYMPEELMLREIDSSRMDTNKRRASELWTEVKENGMILLRSELAGVISKLVEAVTPDEEGNKKRFYSTSVTNLTDFFEVFEDRDLADDSKLQAMVTEFKALVEGKPIEAFKTDEGWRETVRTAGAEISKSLESLLLPSNARIIELED